MPIFFPLFKRLSAATDNVPISLCIPNGNLWSQQDNPG